MTDQPDLKPDAGIPDPTKPSKRWFLVGGGAALAPLWYVGLFGCLWSLDQDLNIAIPHEFYPIIDVVYSPLFWGLAPLSPVLSDSFPKFVCLACALVAPILTVVLVVKYRKME